MSKLTKEDLRYTKFIVQNEEESKKVQEHLFRLGVRWITNDIEISCCNSSFLYINNNLILTHTKADFDYFNNQLNKLILASDILEIPLPEPKYRPCENVTEAKKFLKRNIYCNECGSKHYIIGTDEDSFIITDDNEKYHFISWLRAYNSYKILFTKKNIIGIEIKDS